MSAVAATYVGLSGVAMVGLFGGTRRGHAFLVAAAVVLLLLISTLPLATAAASGRSNSTVRSPMSGQVFRTESATVRPNSSAGSHKDSKQSAHSLFSRAASSRAAGSVVPASTSPIAWKIADSVAAEAFTGVACPSASDCYATGGDSTGVGFVTATTDGGSTWSPQSVPSRFGDVRKVTCPSISDCFGIGGGVINTTNNGGTWTSQTVPPGSVLFSDIACSSPSDCVAVGNNGTNGTTISTTDGGNTWTSGTVPTTVFALNGVACPSALDCLAVGYSNSSGFGSTQVAIASTDGGKTWTNQTVPPFGSGEFLSVTCPSTLDCFAVGNSSNTSGQADIIFATTDGGANMG